MLISPPFLPQRQEQQSENSWLDAAMLCGQPGDGAFPVSFQLGWHGGVHLTAPITGSETERVRAIADGTVVFMRPAAPRVDDLMNPLNYRGWTDNGCVVLRHRTAIGIGPQAEEIEFFSIYMHLSQVSSSILKGRRVYRKEILGQAGQIYASRERKIHFEIVCDDANVRRLFGRSSGRLDTNSDGRTDAVFGSLYFLLPAGTEVVGREPIKHMVAPHFQPPRSTRGAALPAPLAITETVTTDRSLIVELRFAGGDGALEQRGDLLVTTREINGRVLNSPLHEAEAEYKLFDDSKSIADGFPAHRAPTQANVLELLRFGRLINAAHEGPITEEIPHWRKITHPGGAGWVNLNGQGIRKFSDADSPDWCEWTLIDDTCDGDSRCDSRVIRQWLGLDGNGEIGTAEETAALTNPEILRRLSKSVCKFPTEWKVEDVEKRWAWLKAHSPENSNPLSEADFKELSTHIAALCIDLPEVHAAQWHWHPLEFIRHFRQCTWFSVEELCQLIPRNLGRNPRVSPPITWQTAVGRLRPFVVHLNITMRKFGIVSRHRQTHFLAQTYIETALWRTMKELGAAHQQRKRDGTLYWPAPAMQYYQAFYGRGAMQLTWAGNYADYGRYRSLSSVSTEYRYVDERMSQTSTHYWGDPRNSNPPPSPKVWYPRFDPDNIATNPFYACDSAGYYWASKNTGRGERNINRVSDQGITTAAVGRVSVLVNGGGYGFAERQGYAVFIDRYLSDTTATFTTKNFVVTHGRHNYDVYVDFTPQRPS